MEFVTSILINSLILFFAFRAYHRTKMQAFGFLILGSALGIICELGLKIKESLPYPGLSNALIVLQIYCAGYVLATISWGVAIYQLISYVLATFDRKAKDDA